LGGGEDGNEWRGDLDRAEGTGRVRPRVLRVALAGHGGRRIAGGPSGPQGAAADGRCAVRRADTVLLGFSRPPAPAPAERACPGSPRRAWPRRRTPPSARRRRRGARTRSGRRG